MSDATDYLNFATDFNAPDTVSAYDELPLWSAMFGLLLLKYVPLQRGLTVLDVGCGTGFPLLELAQRLGAGSTVYGIDPWKTALERAKQKARLCNIHNVEMRLGDAEAMPFPDGQFDLIVSNLGINNFSNPEAVLRECRRVSKSSARIVLTTNLNGHMKEFYDVFESTLKQLGKEKALNALKLHIDNRATVERIARLFENAGFRVSRVHEESSVMRFADGSALFRHYFIKLGFLDGWKSVLDASEHEEVFIQLEKNLNNLAETRGDLTLTIPMAYMEGEKFGR
jgi:arsenite methyltransferase